MITKYNGDEIAGTLTKKDLLNGAWTAPPIYDTENKFIYYPVAKTGIQSIGRGAMKDRSIFHKDNQIKWEEAKERSEKVKDNLFKFSFVRNPYTRTLSAFLYLQRINKIEKKHSFNEWIINTKFPLNVNSSEYTEAIKEKNFHINAHLQPQITSFYDQNVDFVGHQESMEESWEYVCNFLKIDRKLEWKNKAPKKQLVKDYYKDRSIQIVKERYAIDFKYLGYRQTI